MKDWIDEAMKNSSNIAETYLLKLFRIVKRTANMPRCYFVREDIWKEIYNYFDSRLYGRLPLAPLSDPECKYKNVLLCGVPICVIPR